MQIKIVELSCKFLFFAFFGLFGLWRLGEMRADISNTPREEELLLDSAYCMPTIYLFHEGPLL